MSRRPVTLAKDVPNLVELLRSRARELDDSRAFTFLRDGRHEGARLSYRDLDVKARALAARLRQLGLEGHRAILLYPPGADFVTAFCGCLYAGVVAVPVHLPGSRRHLPRLLTVVHDAQPSAALTTAATRRKFRSAMTQAAPLGELTWLDTESTPDGLADAWTPPAVTAETTAFLQYTSGSTAAPRGVVVSHGQVLCNEAMIHRAFGQSADSVVVGWLPLQHDMGLIGNVVQTLYAGAHAILMSPLAFIARPVRWLAAISRYRATTSGGPNFAYELCVEKVAPADLAEFDLGSWRVAFSGAEPVRPATLTRFAERFAPCGFQRCAFFPCYGLAEATLFVSGGEVEAPPRVERFEAAALEEGRAATVAADAPGRDLVSCGRPPAGQEVVVVDPASRIRCPPGRVGEIWVAGANVAQGYWRRAEESDELFRSRLADEPRAGPFLRTGDLGFVDGDLDAGGELFVTGRAKELIILRGRNHYPQDVEATVERAHPALIPGCGAAFGVEVEREERLVVAWERQRRSAAPVEEIAEAVRCEVSEEHGVLLHELVLLVPGSLAKTTSGKVRRLSCRARYLEGRLRILGRAGAPSRPAEDVAPWPEAPRDFLLALDAGERRGVLRSWLRPEIARAVGLPVSRVDDGTPLTGLGLDSLAAVELEQRLEAKLGVEISAVRLLAGPELGELESELLEELEREPEPSRQDDVRSRPESPATPRQGALSDAQQALWFLDKLAPASGVNHIAAAAVASPAFDLGALRRTLAVLARRHPALRSTVQTRRGEARLRLLADLVPDLLCIEATAASNAEVDRCLAQAAYRPFDAASGPLLRLVVVRRTGHADVVLLAVHHMIADFRSLEILTRELGIVYARETGRPAPAPRPAATLRPAAADWDPEPLAGDETDWEYWRRALDGAPPVLELASDRPRRCRPSYRGGVEELRLGRSLAEASESLARRCGATLFMTLLASFQAVLQRYSGQDQVVVGTPTAGRGRPELADRVGYLVNPVALRADLSHDPAFTALLDQVRGTVRGALEHRDYPLARLAERLQPERASNRAPLFQVMLVLYQARGAGGSGLVSLALGRAGGRLRLGELSLESLALREPRTAFDLTLRVGAVDGDLVTSLLYARDLFDATSAARLLRHLRQLLAGAVADPGRNIGGLALLSRGEVAQLRVEWSTPAGAPAAPSRLHELFEAQATRTPDAVALTDVTKRPPGEAQLTYRELERWAERLARSLRRCGVRPEMPVGVCLERSAGLVAALVAVLKAGGAYVPLDPAYPADRLAFMTADSGAAIVLTRRPLPARNGASAPHRIDPEAPVAGSESVVAPAAGDPCHLAYIIYTSGSTGRPKGVAIEHRAAVELVHWSRQVLSDRDLAGVLAATSISFDLSVFELFVPLSRGGRIVLADDVLALPMLPAAERVTLINTVPSALAALLPGPLPAALRVAALAGEALPTGLVDRLHCEHLRPPIRLWNLYGPTEAVTYSTGARLGRGAATAERVPIGRPLAGNRAALADHRLRPLPIGAIGEIVLGGPALARGYLDRPALTAARFLPDPSSPAAGGRLYLTGDLARHLSDGKLDVLGRRDHQVKLRGLRVELGEIERLLAEHPAVHEAAVVTRPGPAGDTVLVAYAVLVADAVTAADAAPGPPALRRFLASRLPAAMVPGRLLIVHALTRTPAGKVDRGALPVPQWRAPEGSAEQLGTPFEELVAGIFSELFGIEHPGPRADFFELGGHSLLALRLVARLRESGGVELPVRQVFESPTVTALAEAVARRRGGAAGESRPVLAPVRRRERMEPSFAQRRLWFLQQLEPADAAYNVPLAVRLTGRLDVAALAASLRELARRQQALRTRFESVGGEPMALVDPPRRITLPVIDLGALPAGRRRPEARARAAAAAGQPFDLSRDSLLRARLVVLGGDEHVLLLTLHHIVTDGGSMGILGRELESLYGAFARRRLAPLPKLEVQYADFADWQRRWLSSRTLESQLAAWRRRLEGLAPVLELPTDRPRPRRRHGGRRAVSASARGTAHQGAREPRPRRWNDALHDPPGRLPGVARPLQRLPRPGRRYPGGRPRPSARRGVDRPLRQHVGSAHRSFERSFGRATPRPSAR